jgi:signal recognition particle GTPase
MNFSKKIIIITGHYGAGKTNFAVNLALHLGNMDKQVTVADLDIVNPYFRTADFKELFANSGIRLAVSDYANTALDIPSVNLNIKGEVDKSDYLIIDVGGDKEGAKALGRFNPVLTSDDYGYEMVYVINENRGLTQTADEAVEIMKQIEVACDLKCTHLFNNSHLCNETTPEIIEKSLPFAQEVSKLTGLPLLNFPVKIYVKPIWEVS